MPSKSYKNAVVFQSLLTNSDIFKMQVFTFLLFSKIFADDIVDWDELIAKMEAEDLEHHAFQDHVHEEAIDERHHNFDNLDYDYQMPESLWTTQQGLRIFKNRIIDKRF
jgi:hypothetical protein